MKTKKYPGRNSKNGSESSPQGMRRRKNASPKIKPPTKSPRGRKALKERKNTLKVKVKGHNELAKQSLKANSTEPASTCPAAGSKTDVSAKGILDKEKLKKLLSGVAKSKEVGLPVESRSEPTKGKQSANEEVEKRTLQAMHKENIMKPIIDKDKLKKILNGLSQAKDIETKTNDQPQADLRPGAEAVPPIVNKDKLKSLLNKLYEIRESEGETAEDSTGNSDLGGISAKPTTVETLGFERVREKLKRRLEARSVDDIKSTKSRKQACILGFKDKLRRRAADLKIDVAAKTISASSTLSASDTLNLKEMPAKESTSSDDDDDVIFLKNQHQSKCNDKSKAVIESDQHSPSPKHGEELTCNFDKQKLLRLLSSVPQIQDLTAKTSMPVSSANTSCHASNPKQCTVGNTNSPGKYSEPMMPEAPFSLSNELLKSNVMTKSAGDGSITLRGIMIDRLNAARFRYINEQLYMSTGDEAQQFFTKDPEAFTVYHQGYQSQVNKWPVSPLNVIIDDIARRKQPLIIADFGCGDARLAKSVPNKVHSFDLVALNDLVTVCNMAKVPLKSTSVDVAVFCLSLMGTNLNEYLLEANRILKMGGILKIAEVESRFESIPGFIKQLGNLGFSLMKQDTSHKMFVFLDFAKKKNCTKKNIVNISLHPCLYKKR